MDLLKVSDFTIRQSAMLSLSVANNLQLFSLRLPPVPPPHMWISFVRYIHSYGRTAGFLSGFLGPIKLYCPFLIFFFLTFLFNLPKSSSDEINQKLILEDLVAPKVILRWCNSWSSMVLDLSFDVFLCWWIQPQNKGSRVVVVVHTISLLTNYANLEIWANCFV